MGYKHFSKVERIKLEGFLNAGMRVDEIAGILNKHRSSIYREINRGQCVQMNSDLTKESRYVADTAEDKYRENLKAKGRELKIEADPELAKYIEKKISKDKYSPAAVLGEIIAKEIEFDTEISETTLYSYIDRGYFETITNKDLPIKRNRTKRVKKVKTIKRVSNGKSIEQRPEEISDRQEFGHWEMDSVVGKQGTTAALLVLTERKTRDEIVRKVPNKEMKTIVNELDKIENWLGPERFALIFKSITVDNGSEFQDCEGLERHASGDGKRTEIYYCHPYCSSERGSNENQNRLIRRHYPKGYDFTNVTQEEIDKVEKWINDYPRELFEWQSAGEQFKRCLEEVIAAKN